MSVKDRIKLFEKTNTVVKPNFVAPVRISSESVCSPVGESPPRAITPPIFASSQVSAVQPPLNQREDEEMTELSSTSPPRAHNNIPFPVSPVIRIDEDMVCMQVINSLDEPTINAEFMADLLELNSQNSMDHSVILNKPLFPKPALFLK